MTLTRSKTGSTPRKPAHPDFVETPARTKSVRRSRKSAAASNSSLADPGVEIHSSGKRKSEPNGESRGPGRPRKDTGAKRSLRSADEDADSTAEFEFGGSLGVSAMMLGFPLLMWYMWIGATYYDGKLPWPSPGQSIAGFLSELGRLVYTGAFPTLKAWTMYWTFFVFEAVCYLYLPGVYAKGKALPHLGGQQLDYYCSGVASFYLTIVLAVVLHVTKLFPLYTLVDEFGPLMSVAIISGFLVSIAAYASALYRGAQRRMTGHHIYDFFMGAELNPRILGLLDFKMFFEVRLPWFILFLVTLGACARQHEQLGFVSGELAFLLMAHFLYANACCKGEQMIPTTWDMFYEKWGFMLIFWNMAGVPLSYCHATIYLANHAPLTYRWPRPFLAFLFASYLLAYWVWDTCGSQKNGFRAAQRGSETPRSAFPQLPWRSVGANPRVIRVPGGDDLLADGWYRYGRKLHYTADMWFAVCWALVTGFGSPFPWFYPTFFAAMITHRARRDIRRCKERYGAAWDEFERLVPYLFIPYVY